MFSLQEREVTAEMEEVQLRHERLESIYISI
jgi:hypothetical protein